MHITEIHGVVDLWARTIGDPDIRVAILDGPAELDHDCFRSARISQGRGRDSRYTDAFALDHGTHVASLIFGQHSSVVKGVAPGCSGIIYPIFGGEHRKGPEDSFQVADADLADAINQAGSDGAHVINISAGRGEKSLLSCESLGNVVRRWVDRGVLIVAAAGNDGCQHSHCDYFYVPAAFSEVLAVGALDSGDEALHLSNWNEIYRGHSLLAPGQFLVGASAAGGSVAKSGTSFATAVVSGVAALLMSLQLRMGLKPDGRLVRDSLLSSLRPCHDEGMDHCKRMLDGRLDVGRATYTTMNQGLPPMSTSVHFEGPGELPALNCVEPAAGNESGQLAAAIPMRTMALQGCSCGSGHGSCSCGTKAKTDQTILVLGLGTLEAEFRSDSQVRYFREHGPFPEFDPSDQREIGKILIATRYRPRQVLFVPPYITWASELNWYLRVHLPRKLLIRPCAPWAELKYRGLSYFLAGEPDPSIPVGPTPAPAPGGVGDPQARDYDPIYDEAGDVAQIGHGPHRPHHDFGPDVPQPEGVHGHPIPADPFKGFGIPILPDLVKRYVLIAGYGKKGANLTVVDPVVEGLYELTIFELAITIYLEQPTMSKQTFTRIVSSLRFLFAKYPNEGTTDEGRAINAALLRGINFILSVILESGPDWELRTLSAAATQGAEPSDRIWDVTVTFVNTKNTFTSSIAIVLQMDVTDVLPSMIGVYQTQGTES